MITNFILAPIFAHMITAILLLFFWRNIAAQRVISVVGNILAFLLCLRLFYATDLYNYLIVQVGSWEAPFGIIFVSDTFSSIMVLLTAIVSLAVGIYSTAALNPSRIKYGYFVIFHFLVMGLLGAFLTGDIFNLYVWFEVVIISSFVLLTLGGKKMQMEGAIKYVAMNMLASIIFLTAIGILYGITGTLNMADLAVKIDEIQNKGLVSVTALLFFAGFGIKSAVFPMYFWLPSSYHTPPSAIAAIFGGLLTKMGVYAMIRSFTLIFQPDEFTKNVFIVIAILTMVTGALGTVNKRSIRRLLSYLIVCHIGYLIAGIGIYTEIVFVGVIFYLMHDVIVKSNLLMITGIIQKMRGTVDMTKLGGLYKDYPKLSLVIGIAMFSLVGIPPLSGFWPKIQFFGESLKSGHYFLFGAFVLASFVTLFVMAKMWSEVFWKNSPTEITAEIDQFKDLLFVRKLALVLPVSLLSLVSLYLGLNAGEIYELAQETAAELMNPHMYIDAVLNGNYGK
ncbi:proton-conducting transporter transmembrane domain-containing protein [Moheibacter lacus]|uniref:Na+/H+ antiporter subunit D n=1 Tax=Moheibacter lacus TaxID=2745851 RepID=A0A838ZTW5_9FLAO|nr:proton-conducting transporter membrane subunit [Moheibacter lacus]MBA5630434.1 Na+/H+ antiporter subunit D [Moheibacter lacus]